MAIAMLIPEVREILAYRGVEAIGGVYREVEGGEVKSWGSFKGEDYHSIEYWDGRKEKVLPVMCDPEILDDETT